MLLGIGAGLVFDLGAVAAQQRPPVAAPTSTVQVNALPLVRPEGEALDDFLSGLADGLMKTYRVPGMTIAVVKNGDALVEKSFGAGVDPLTTQFRAGSLSGVITAVAALQLIEQARVLGDEDVGAALGDNDRHLTMDDCFLGRGDPALLGAVVEKISGARLGDYARDHVLTPLGMAHSVFDSQGFATTAGDMSRFMLALLGGGAYENARVLAPESAAQMQTAQFTFHPALAGWSYGFAGLHRNGWRGVQRDGEAPGAEARLVLVPEAHTGYFIAISTRAGAKFWRTLDNALFDRLFAPRAETAVLSGAAPSEADAREASGVYELGQGEDFLRVEKRPLVVNARGDGALVLTGAEEAVLLPQAGGFWRSDSPSINAVLNKNRLVLDARIYDPVPWWLRIPLWAIALILLVALALLGYGMYRIVKA